MEMKIREMTLDGLTLIARGGTGDCWRIDDETLLKLYYEGMPEERAYREKESARTAFSIGVPTAISYELVRVGNRLGVIYETLKGCTLSQKIQEEPDRIPELAGKYAEIAWSLHGVRGDRSRFPASTQVIRSEVPKADYLSAEGRRHIMDFLDELDGYDRYVHGDFHLNNVLINGDDMMLIDLGGFSVGCPLFDLATTRFCLYRSPDAECEVSPFTGLTKAQHAAFWEAFISRYFSVPAFREPWGEDPDRLINDVTLLKLFRFERLYGDRKGTPGYHERIRKEVIARWETT